MLELVEFWSDCGFVLSFAMVGEVFVGEFRVDCGGFSDDCGGSALYCGDFGNNCGGSSAYCGGFQENCGSALFLQIPFWNFL